jgi:hypothetical protein
VERLRADNEELMTEAVKDYVRINAGREEIERLRAVIATDCKECGRALPGDGDCHGCRADKLETELERLRREYNLLRGLLFEVSHSAVEFEDERCGYVVQIDRKTWQEITEEVARCSPKATEDVTFIEEHVDGRR